MSDTPQDLAQVEKLLAERDALHGWLAKLDATGDRTPAAVRERVRADYQERLDEVGGQLASHGDTLERKLAEDQSEHDHLSARMQAAREALAEVELRHTVGEFDDQRFESERAGHVGDLETYEVSISAVAERIARLEDAVALVERAPLSETGAGERVVPITELAEDDRGGAEADPPNGEAEGEDSLQTEALLAVFGESAMTIEVEEPTAFEAPTEDDPAADDEDASEPEVAGFGPLSFTRSGEVPVPPVSRGGPPPPIGMPASDQTPRFVRPGGDRGSELTDSQPSRPAEQVRVIQDPEPMIPEVSSESEVTPRTLRCGECGAMNRPLEWYCEKCGAELSAV